MTKVDDVGHWSLAQSFAPLPRLGRELGRAQLLNGLVAVHKPAGVPGRKTEARGDDVLARASSLAAWLKQNAPEEVSSGLPSRLYLHETLDREVSGVVLLGADKALNAALATLFEGGAHTRVWHAWVKTDAPVKPWACEDRLVSVSASGGQPAHMTVSTDERRGRVFSVNARQVRHEDGYALLVLETHHARSHAIRAQLAARGLPILGDTLYGGEPSERLMLHASELHLRHPGTSAPLEVGAALPPSFAPWRDGLSKRSLDSIVEGLQEAATLRASLFGSRTGKLPTTAFRWVHGRADGFAPLAIDLYGEHAVLQLYETLSPELEARITDALMRLGAKGVYLKRRPRQANTLTDTRTEDVAPTDPVAGVPVQTVLAMGAVQDVPDAPALFEPAPFDTATDAAIISESGIPYHARLGDGLSTGIFLDQRDNRERLFAMSEGKRVLNLFAYTCPFTMAAVAGGAKASLSVDAAAPALAWGERNLSLLKASVDVGEGHHAFVKADVFARLDELAAAKERFDIVVVDPPTYSLVKASRWKSGKDWSRLAAGCARVLKQDGILLATSNDRRMSSAPFVRFVTRGIEHAGRVAHGFKLFDPPYDFPPDPDQGPHLKTILVRVGGELRVRADEGPGRGAPERAGKRPQQSSPRGRSGGRRRGRR